MSKVDLQNLLIFSCSCGQISLRIPTKYLFGLRVLGVPLPLIQRRRRGHPIAAVKIPQEQRPAQARLATPGSSATRSPTPIFSGRWWIHSPRPDLERRLYDRTRHHGHLPLVLGDERPGQEVDSGERGHVGCGSKGGQEAGRPAAAFCSGMLEHGHENHRLCLYATVGEPPGTRRSR